MITDSRWARSWFSRLLLFQTSAAD